MLQCHVFLPGWSTCVFVILYKFLMGASRFMVGATHSYGPGAFPGCKGARVFI